MPQADPPLSPSLIAGLAVEAEKLSREGQRLSDELHVRSGAFQEAAERFEAAAETQRRYIILRTVSIIVGLMMLAGLGWIAYLNNRSGDAIRSCTTPGEACYDRAQEAQGQVIADLVTAICRGQNPDSPVKVQECVSAALDVPPSDETVSPGGAK